MLETRVWRSRTGDSGLPDVRVRREDPLAVSQCVGARGDFAGIQGISSRLPGINEPSARPAQQQHPEAGLPARIPGTISQPSTQR